MSSAALNEETNQMSGSPPASQQSPRQQQQLAVAPELTQSRQVVGDKSEDPQVANNQQQQQHHSSNGATSPTGPQQCAAVSNPDTRTHVVGELYDTERSYVESLQILVEKYMKPLKIQECNRNLIDSSLVDEIFYTIPEILKHHETFLGALQDRLSSDWDTSQVIGNVFIEAFTNQQIIDTYTAFINNWKNARQVIKLATQTKPAFERFLEAMSREHRNKLTLDALLIMPVQRIPRYELLIKELIKHTPEDHPDYGPLIEAQKQIHELALKIDRAEKEMIHQEQLKDLEALIDGHIELQHPQRNFIRYDLVTILGTSALTVAKKERVLFLFCDLLIMTSVKKKASRRSNLQTAFANSSNDLSLLEGNKFKLLLRVQLDQVEIRLANDQIQLQHQQQEQQHQMQLQQQSKLLQDRKHEIETDLCILHQIESLTHKMNIAEKSKIDDTINELSSQLRQRLFSLERSDIQAITLLTHPSQTSHDLYSAQPATSSAPPNFHTQSSDFLTMLSVQQPTSSINISCQQQQLQGLNVTSTSGLVANVSPIAGSSVTNQQEQNISLEFVISNSASNAKDSNADFNPSDQQAQALTNATDAQSGLIHSGQSSVNSETLVVTFTSIDRRQAFLQAFIEAKQLRYQQQQHRQQQQQQQRIYSSSVTLKLAPLESPEKRVVCNDPRRSKLQHQDNVDIRKSAIINSSSPIHAPKAESRNTVDVASRISSAPLSQQPSSNATIVHQMSAPQPIAPKTGSPLDPKDHSSSRCASCSSNPFSHETADKHRFHHHHHHQLMHQPASHPTSLDTICCHEQHNDEHDLTLLDSQLSRPSPNRSGQTNQAYEALNQPGDQLDYRQTINVAKSTDTFNGQDLIAKANSQKAQLISHINRTLFFKFSPKFLAAIPMNFLNTPHPALQFTSSANQFQLTPQHTNNGAGINGMSKSQTVKDGSNNLWLCMSNGYVSHVALIMLKKRRSSHLIEASKSELGSVESQFYKQQYDIVPVIRSAGDICKSQINCIVQVGSVSRVASQRTSKDLDKTPEDSRDATSGTKEHNTQGHECDNDDKRPVLEIAIKSASPPLDMKSRPSSCANSRGAPSRLSESAPSRCSPDSFGREECGSATSASTTLLEVPARAKHKSPTTVEILRPRVANPMAGDSKISLHNSTCHRQQDHNSETMKDSRLHPNPLVYSQHHSFDDSASRAGYHHHHHHQHHQHHHHSHHHHHHHPHNHHGQAHHLHSHGAYSLRHHTVPLAELRKALERQNRVFGDQTSRSGHLAPPANTPALSSQGSQHFSSLDLAEHGPNGFGVGKMRSSTPPAGFTASKSFRSARSLRHQASLKTSSILAKLVGSASKKSAYLRKSGSARESKPSETDDHNENTDTDANHKSRQARNDNDNVSIDSNILGLTTPSASKCLLSTSNSDVNQVVVSPLSSMSSLNSANSSITVNSVCASSPNRSTCDMLAHSSSATCCVTSCLAQQSSLSPSPVCSAPDDECKLRSRSATVPCRASLSHSVEPPSLGQGESDRPQEDPLRPSSYRVSDIIKDINDQLGSQAASRESISGSDSSLWLGCDDGSLIVIDCLIRDCNLCDLGQSILNCGNVHSEVKLSSAVCDICTFKDEMVFVALSNGQLAIFSRTDTNNKDDGNSSWSLTNPRIFTVTANELNSTSKLCLVDEEHLWYSFGRNIFVLNVLTMKIETKIMAPTNDLSLQFTMQSMTIENMELMENFSGVWVSFKNSHVIQFYDIRHYKLLVEINLFEAVNNMLSYGNEIIRQHKTACLKATSLLNLSNKRENYNTLFIGTSAGIILYLNMTQEQLTSIEQLDGAQVDLKPQVASLRHGHSGQVKFLHLIHIDGERDGDELDDNNNAPTGSFEKELYLVSGGSGVDLYGPGEMQQAAYQFNSEEDSMNRLILWQL